MTHLWVDWRVPVENRLGEEGQGMKGSLERGLELEAESEFEIGDTEDRVRQFRKR